MKFLALALDYDGTIANNDIVDPHVRDAITGLRANGIIVLLVTGRTLADLRRVVGDLRFVDAVVAENGAVIEFSDSGYSTVIAAAPPPKLLDALRQEGISHIAGQSVIDASANDAQQILAILQRLELPLVLLFNRSRVMILPQAISKSTGLRQALTTLRLSPHNTIGIGDAENDHELLQACELGIAVAWGSEFLKQSADLVLPGTGPAAVAEYIQTLAKHGQMPVPSKARRKLVLGYTDGGKRLALAARDRNILVAGDPKSGKSWVAGLLCEQLILFGYSLLLIDPEGDYTSLEALPGVVLFGGADPLPRPRQLLRALRHADTSIVIDLSHTPHAAKLEYVRSLLPGMAMLRRQTGFPHGILVDEAHYFLRDSDMRALLDLEAGGYTFVSYRASKLHPDLLAATEAIVVTRESDPDEISVLRTLCSSCESELSEEDWRQTLGSLVIGEAVALPLTAEAEGSMRRVQLAQRLTPHARHAAKYVDIPIPEQNAFVFWRNGVLDGRIARTLREFVEIVQQLPASELDGHLRRGDCSSWIARIFGDYLLANTVEQLEAEYRRNGNLEIVPSIVQAIRSRYQFVERELP